jgi:hypothetical protein
MNPDPFSDTITFLLQPGLTTAIFWLLLIASTGVAAYVFRAIPGQRSMEHVGNWAFRVLIGCTGFQPPSGAKLDERAFTSLVDSANPKPPHTWLRSVAPVQRNKARDRAWRVSRRW